MSEGKSGTGPAISLEGFETSAGKRLAKPAYRAAVHLYPHANDPVFSKRKSSSPRYLSWEADKTEGTVTQLTWSKRLGQPSAQWSAQVKLGRGATLDPMAGDVLDGDWADLFVLRNDTNFPLGRGVVDTVRESRTTAGGATVKNLSLTGRDHGALFEAIIAWNQIYAQNVKELTTGIFTNSVKHNVGGTPDEMFKLLIDSTFGQGTSTTKSAWAVPPSLKSLTGFARFGELIDIRTEPLRGALFNLHLWTQAGQSLHQLLNQWCNPLLNEWRYDADSKPGKSKIATYAEIRERPYVNTVDGMGSAYFSLPTWTIPNWLVTDRDLGRSGHERFTAFELVADWQFGTQQEQSGLAPPIWSPQDVTNYGVRPYLESTVFVANGADGSWVKDRTDWQRLVADWFAPNPYLLSGSITFGCMLPEIRIGDRLVIDTGDQDTSFQGYIEGVDHNFQWATDGSAGPRTQTVATVTRGWIGKDQDLLKMVKALSARFKENF